VGVVIVYDDDGVPLPPDPDEVEQDYPDDDGWAETEAEDDPPEPLPGEAAREVAERQARVHALARRVHVAPTPPSGLYLRLGGEFDPRGRHVGCDGDADGARGCGAAPGIACSAPGRRFIPGFVHPSRLAAERMLFGLDDSPVAV
jgi:hypothetical protein